MDFPNELFIEIFSYLDLASLIQLCKTCKSFNDLICKDERTFMILANSNYKFHPVLYDKLNESPCENYKFVVDSYINFIKNGIEYDTNIGFLYKLHLLSNTERRNLSWHRYITVAVYKNNLDMVKFLFREFCSDYQYHTWGDYIHTAIWVCNLEMVKFFFDKTPDNYEHDWDDYVLSNLDMNKQISEYIHSITPVMEEVD